MASSETKSENSLEANLATDSEPKLAPSSGSSFGIADSLDRSTPIYHTVLYNTVHSGRVADVITAFLGSSLQSNPRQEFRLRNLINLALFESYFSQFLMQKSDLTNPTILECGLDFQRLAIGLSFILNAENNLNLTGLEERLKQNAPNGPFEDVLIQILHHSDLFMIKYYPLSRRIELNATLLNEVPEPGSQSNSGTFELVVFGGDVQPTVPADRAYVDLGDLKYPKFLAKEIYGTIESSNATDDFFTVKKAPAKKSFLSKIFGRGIIGQAFDQERIVVGQPSQSAEPLTVIPGQTDFPDFNADLFKVEDSSSTDLLSELEADKSEQLVNKVNELLNNSEAVRNSKAKQWLDGVLATLLAEKAKVKHLAQELNQSMMKRESDYKNQIMSLNSELIETKKQFNAETKRNQILADQQAVLDRQAKRPTQEESSVRHTREEYAALRTTYEAQQVQLEEFKRTNRRLMEKLNEYMTPGNNTNDSEAKKKLSAAMRLLSISRKETEGMRAFVEKLRSNEIALRKKIEELDNANSA